MRFVFELTEAELQKIEAAISKSTRQPSPPPPIVIKGGAPLSLSQYIRETRQILYEVDLKKKTRTFKYWKMAGDVAMAPDWLSPADGLPDNTTITDSSGKTVVLKQLKLIHSSLVDDKATLSSTFVEAKADALHAIIGGALVAGRDASLPVCVSWKYSEANLLPAQIAIETFRSNPDSCVPLKNMFQLAKIANISEEIVAKQAQTIHQFRNLLNRVATATTEHIRAVWPEYKDIQIDLAPNGPNIDASVLDSTIHFEFSRRSDGFKRFVTFLLMISAKVRAGSLSNTLILIDEPEGSLHPSGARHLLRELLRVAENNLVVLSTHSIFMIDKDNIGRHLIVKKHGSITSLTTAEGGNIVDEEVLYDAVGFSIFEALAARNILFEGWRDKRLFDVALSAVKDEVLKTKLEKLGRCHAKGVKDIRSIAAFVEMAKRHAIILSDSDDPAKQAQRQYRSDHRSFSWKRYDELGAPAVVTAEDFLKPEAFQTAIQDTRSRVPALGPLADADLTGPEGRLAAIRKWLDTAGLTAEQLKIEIDQIKSTVFDALEAKHIDPAYESVLAYLAEDANWMGS